MTLDLNYLEELSCRSQDFRATAQERLEVRQILSGLLLYTEAVAELIRLARLGQRWEAETSEVRVRSLDDS